ncbi:MAG: hypothetical protein KC620_16915 [Myxococcales bacterium]|nr:hypothetical protein [Myxococcales bacterium]
MAPHAQALAARCHDLAHWLLDHLVVATPTANDQIGRPLFDEAFTLWTQICQAVRGATHQRLHLMRAEDALLRLRQLAEAADPSHLGAPARLRIDAETRGIEQALIVWHHQLMARDRVLIPAPRRPVPVRAAA